MHMDGIPVSQERGRALRRTDIENQKKVWERTLPHRPLATGLQNRNTPPTFPLCTVRSVLVSSPVQRTVYHLISVIDFLLLPRAINNFKW